MRTGGSAVKATAASRVPTAPSEAAAPPIAIAHFWRTSECSAAPAPVMRKHVIFTPNQALDESGYSPMSMARAFQMPVNSSTTYAGQAIRAKRRAT